MGAFPFLNLIVDPSNPNGSLVVGPNNQVTRGIFPNKYLVVNSDMLPLRVRAVSPSSSALRQYDDIDLSDANVAASIGELQTPYSTANLPAVFPPANVGIQVLQFGDSTHQSIQQITLDPAPYGGTFTFTLGTKTWTVPYNISGADLQSLVGPNYVVNQTALFSWTIAAVANGTLATIIGNAAGLLVPVGKSGNLYLNTLALQTAFAATTADSLPVLLEVKILFPGAPAPQTVMQLKLSINRAVLDPSAQVPPTVAITGWIYLRNIVNRTGGNAATDLDALVTAGVFVLDDVIWTQIGGLTAFKFLAGAANPADSGQIAPPDYDADTNNFHWEQQI